VKFETRMDEYMAPKQVAEKEETRQTQKEVEQDSEPVGNTEHQSPEGE
jgi:hypothetical protein